MGNWHLLVLSSILERALYDASLSCFSLLLPSTFPMSCLLNADEPDGFVVEKWSVTNNISLIFLAYAICKFNIHV